MAYKRRTYPVRLSFPIESYHPDALRNAYTERQLREEYSRLRDVAQKRLKTIGKSEFSGRQTYLYNKNRYLKTRDIKKGDISTLTHLLSDLARFLTAKTGSLSGMREARDKAIESWHEMGLTWINKKNFFDWVDYMEYVRDRIGVLYNFDLVQSIFKDRYIDKKRDLNTIRRTFVRFYQGQGSYTGGGDVEDYNA